MVSRTGKNLIERTDLEIEEDPVLKPGNFLLPEVGIALPNIMQNGIVRPATSVYSNA
jgi:hypothetical protein